MKLLLSFAFCMVCICASAQVPKNSNPYRLQLPDTMKRFKANESTLEQLREYWQRKQMRNNLFANKNDNIVILPQDHMPCVVPDTIASAKIPNAWTSVTVPYIEPNHSIPNPGLPKKQSFTWNALDNGLGITSK